MLNFKGALVGGLIAAAAVYAVMNLPPELQESKTGPIHRKKPFGTFEEFYPFYQTEHTDHTCRLLHVM